MRNQRKNPLLVALAFLSAVPLAANAQHVFSTIDFPGATLTEPTAVNASGEIVGFYVDSTGNTEGFLISRETFQIFAARLDISSAYGIKDNGQIVGIYVDTSGVDHGFPLSGGTYTTIDVPFAGAFDTVLADINSSGESLVSTWTAPESPTALATSRAFSPASTPLELPPPRLTA
jgi:hypothetical protein